MSERVKFEDWNAAHQAGWDARARMAEQQKAELVEFAKGVVNDCLLRALSGSDENLRTPDGCIRWGRVEREIGEGIEAFSKALDKHEKEQGDD